MSRFHPREYAEIVDPDQYRFDILAYWSARYNTADIARLLGRPECEVANLLPCLLEWRRSGDRNKEEIPHARIFARR